MRLTARLVMTIGGVMLAGCAEPTKITVLPANAVMVARVIPSGVAAKNSDCAIKTLDKMPGQDFHDLGTIRLAGFVPAATDVTTLLDQQACALGADAIFVNDLHEQSAGARVEYKVVATAVGWSAKPESGPSKTITPADSEASSREGVNAQRQAEDITVSDTASAPPALEAPVIPLRADDQESQSVAPAEPSAPQLPAADASPSELLMQPVEPEAGTEDDGKSSRGQGEESAAISESAIPATEAAPLRPVEQPRAPVTTPSAAPSPMAQVGASPTATPGPSPEGAVAQSESPTPSATSSPTPVQTSTPTPRTETPTPAPTPSPSMILTPTPTPSSTPSATPTVMPTPIGSSTPAAMPTASPAPAMTSQSTASAIATTTPTTPSSTPGPQSASAPSVLPPALPATTPSPAPTPIPSATFAASPAG